MPKKLTKTAKRQLQDKLGDIGEECLEYGLHDIVRRINEIQLALEDA
jgi:hypothetical protein